MADEKPILSSVEFQMVASVAAKFNYSEIVMNAKACYEAHEGKTISTHLLTENITWLQQTALRILYEVMYKKDDVTCFPNQSYRLQRTTFYIRDTAKSVLFPFGALVATYEGGRLMLTHVWDSSSCEWEKNLITIEYWKRQHDEEENCGKIDSCEVATPKNNKVKKVKSK